MPTTYCWVGAAFRNTLGGNGGGLMEEGVLVVFRGFFGGGGLAEGDNLLRLVGFFLRPPGDVMLCYKVNK